MNHVRRNSSAVCVRAALIACALIASQANYAPVAHAVPTPSPLNWTGAYIAKGTTEYAFAGAIGLKPSNVYSVSGTFGPFITDNIQLAGTLQFDKVEDFTATSYGVEANYHAPLSSPQTYYFAGGFVGGTHVSGDEEDGDSTTVGGQIGLKHFLTPYVAITGGIDFRHPTKSGFRDTTDLMFGLSTFSQPGRSGMGSSSADVAAILPDKGTNEIGLSGNIGLQPSNVYNVSVSYGPFVSRQLQIAGNVSFAKAGDVTNTLYGVEANMHFPSTTSPMVPFIGAFVGGDHVSGGGESGDSTAYGAQGGVKYFLNSNVAAEGSLVYRHPTKSGFDDTTEIDLGLGIYLHP